MDIRLPSNADCASSGRVLPVNHMDTTSYAACFARVKEDRPLVHHITNTVTINDCANITLCCGAAPVMAEAPEEVGEMTALADALVLNIGTLNRTQVESMVLAGKMANEKGIPIILDPVGAGATQFRTTTVRSLMGKMEIAVLKGNAGEIGVLAGEEATVRGVDSAGLIGDPVRVTSAFADECGCTVVMTGPEDVISDGKRTFIVENGHPWMENLSGTGCMAASLVGAFSAVSEDTVIASAAALSAFGLAAERSVMKSSGPCSFRTGLFDELAALMPVDIRNHARIRVK